jgi:hypothetical protein
MRKWTTDLNPTHYAFYVRFDQGYRYLDKCGEAIIRLEDKLQEGWLPGGIDPNGANLRNFALGMSTRFNYVGMETVQTEFLAFDIFLDQTCRIYETLLTTFGIKRILTPTLRSIYQLGFSNADDADEVLLGLKLCSLDESIMQELSGKTSSVALTMVAEENVTWNRGRVKARKRLDAKVIKQERQPQFDERIMMRLKQIPERYHGSLEKLRSIRRQHSQQAEIAIQFDLEYAFDSELSGTTFATKDFISAAGAWSVSLRNFIDKRMERLFGEHDRSN